MIMKETLNKGVLSYGTTKLEVKQTKQTEKKARKYVTLACDHTLPPCISSRERFFFFSFSLPKKSHPTLDTISKMAARE